MSKIIIDGIVENWIISEMISLPPSSSMQPPGGGGDGGCSAIQAAPRVREEA